MTYFADLTPYEYLGAAADPALVNVGWLDRGHVFATGSTDSRVSGKVLDLCLRHRVRQTRGYHLCPFCERPTMGIKLEAGGAAVTLGSAEIRVQGTDRSFASPDLIYHYMVAHAYRPPEVFLRAVELL